jgi:predicted alpha/beta-hydrolase family hydrolase
VLVTAFGALANCGREPARNARAARVDPAASVAEECPDEDIPDGMARLSVTAADGVPIGVAVVGEGETAVVLVHGAGQDVCDWMDVVPAISDLGVTVAAYGLRGRGSSGGSRNEVSLLPEDLDAVVTALRERGVERVVLVGSSLGAATSLIGAGSIDPPVDAVVAVSPPLALGGTDVAAAAQGYEGPVVLLVAEGDGRHPQNVAELASALPDVRATIVLDGSDHGMRLIKSRLRDVSAAVEQAVGAAQADR